MFKNVKNSCNNLKYFRSIGHGIPPELYNKLEEKRLTKNIVGNDYFDNSLYLQKNVGNFDENEFIRTICSTIKPSKNKFDMNSIEFWESKGEW